MLQLEEMPTVMSSVAVAVGLVEDLTVVVLEEQVEVQARDEQLVELLVAMADMLDAPRRKAPALAPIVSVVSASLLVTVPVAGAGAPSHAAGCAEAEGPLVGVLGVIQDEVQSYAEGV